MLYLILSRRLAEIQGGKTALVCARKSDCRGIATAVISKLILAVINDPRHKLWMHRMEFVLSFRQLLSCAVIRGLFNVSANLQPFTSSSNECTSRTWASLLSPSLRFRGIDPSLAALPLSDSRCLFRGEGVSATSTPRLM